MTKRCKHQNGRLIEISEATHDRDVTNGVLADDGLNDIGNIIRYEYQCRDCKKFWVAPTATSFKQKFINQIGRQL